MTDAELDALDLPPAFLDRNGEDPLFLRALPRRLAELSARWSLTLEPHFPGIAYNYVAPCRRADGTPCVLKLSRYIAETRSEIAALRLWQGDGAARLLDADEEMGALLLERLEPGTMLSEVAAADDDAATVITAGLLRRLWQPASSTAGSFIPLDRWCAAYDRNRRVLAQGVPGFPAALFQRADALRRDLLASTETPLVLHGDMHHFNVLRAQGAAWSAIDPKGLLGDRCFDICQFLRNPLPLGVPPSVNSRRLDIFCAELGLDCQRVKAWCLVHAVLDACWDFEDGRPWQRAVAYAESTQSF
jgi:streptomycin 6-kinase